MSVATIRTQIVAVMNTVPDIGVVHEYERFSANLSDLKAHYYSTAHGSIRGWFVRRENTQEVGKIQPASVEKIRWRLQGFMSLSDATQSEIVCDALIEALRDTFRANDLLNGSVAQCSLPSPGGGSGEAGLQLVDFGSVMFADVLCHGVRLALNTVRYLQ